MTNKNQLFYKYFGDWIELYKVGAIRDVTLQKYKMTENRIQELAPDLKLKDLTRVTYQKLINEPSCGGGMIIATACVLRNEGINYQRKIDVVAQDLDWKGVYMCYLQLSLLGIKAICVQGDTLSNPYIKGKTELSRILITPAKMGVLL